MFFKFVVITSISTLLAGMGIGGGSLFIILGTMFLKISQKSLQGLNLIAFMSTGFAATLSNFKNKKIDKNMCKKLLPGLIIGSIIGIYIASNINEEKLRKYFMIFITIIGLYEIISSLIDIKKGKNNSKS